MPSGCMQKPAFHVQLTIYLYKTAAGKIKLTKHLLSKDYGYLMMAAIDFRLDGICMKTWTVKG